MSITKETDAQWSARMQDKAIPMVATVTATALAPFDPRTEVSADARYIAGKITKCLVIIFVVLPVVVGILIVLAR